MLKTLLQLAPLLMLSADKETTGEGDPLPVVQRTRQPYDFAKGSPEARRLAQCRGAAQTLREQEEKKARDESRKPNATPTAEELFDKATADLEGKGKAGQTINGVYVPTIEEIKAAGYTGDHEKFRADILAQAEGKKPAPSTPPPAVPPLPAAPELSPVGETGSPGAPGEPGDPAKIKPPVGPDTVSE